MSDPPKSLFGDGDKIVVPAPKSKEVDNSESSFTDVNTEKAITLSKPDVEDADAAANAAKLEGKFRRVIEELGSRGYTIDAIGPNPCSLSSSKLLPSFSDKSLDATNRLSYLPNEVVDEIGSGLNVDDLINMRLVNMRFSKAVMFQYGKKTKVTENVTIFPTFSSIASFLVGLSLDGAYARTVQTITLVGEAPKTPELSYDISWIHLMSRHPDPNRSAMPSRRMNHCEMIEAQKVIAADQLIMMSVNDKHEEWDYINKFFCHTGDYRTMLNILLSKLPNLKTIATRKLHAGEHIPGWEGHEALKKLSFYRPHLPINEVYYGDWQYDTVHKRITMYTDEYGEYIEEDDAGPQAGFKEDVMGAMEMSGTPAILV